MIPPSDNANVKMDCTSSTTDVKNVHREGCGMMLARNVNVQETLIGVGSHA